jgi:hypothetical protein
VRLREEAGNLLLQRALPLGLGHAVALRATCAVLWRALGE